MSKFFFDNTTSHRLAHGLKAFGEEVLHLRDQFDPSTPDEQWIPWVGTEGLFLVTHDTKIRLHPAQRKACLEAGLGVFVLSSRVKGHCEIIRMMVNRWTAIKEAAARVRRETRASISGAVSRSGGAGT
jgi:hypothetical protein